jgi:stress-induced morphogen
MTIADDRRSAETRKVEEVLRSAFPSARVDAYRYNSASIRVRMIDSGFAGKDRVEREDLVLPILKKLPPEILGDVTILLLLAPQDVSKSLMNQEFEDPVESGL